MVYLLENQSRVVTRDELLNQIWGYEYDGETRTLDMHIRTLRQSWRGGRFLYQDGERRGVQDRQGGKPAACRSV